MAEIVNLRQARKRKRRDEKERVAETSRIAHGRSASETKQTRLTKDLEAKRLEAHRLDPSDGGDRNL